MTKFSILTIIEIFDLGKLARLAYQIARARALKGSIISKVFDVMGMLFWTLDELAKNAAKTPPPSSPSPTPGPAPVPVPVC